MNALTVGVDTIRITGDDVGVDPAKFTRVIESSEIGGNKPHTRLSYQGKPNEPRLTYYPHDARLTLEVSWPKFAYGHNVRVIDEPRLPIGMINNWLRWFGVSADVGAWRVNRIDYAADWCVGSDLPFYIEGLQKCLLSGHDKSDYESGVMWKSQSRAIKFYNKTLEQGITALDGAVLRFEVSNYRAGVRYICSSQGVVNSLADLSVPSIVKSVLTQWLEKCIPAGFGADESLRARVYAAFGHRAGAALEHLRLINELGTKAYWLGFTNRSSYYRYKRELFAAGLLGVASSSLPLLTIESNR